MSDANDMSTLSRVMEKLSEHGYGQEFRITGKGCELTDTGDTFAPEDLLIVRVFRFEGVSDPADMSVLYAVETSGGTKGYLLDAFGTYSDYDTDLFAKFISQVPVEERDDQILF
ncbi:hypothetical protein EDD80_11276 [Anseongella ginsenosidimutans]|uniref:Phosphoribosylpyrophosphate synthetase n=1 Tax=Anseongella ginsenosidimutans TaxID=496056 RepID=A0A4R3KMH2_9SPHI|nr:hypothetical protein [Anseongella ginsenosidimutans]QEC52745.1 hypothetical protein FRZ59_10620 [Anseongella ginsenosidimutans]TCS85501.1 hypothetical protein EDD80_11276 [Anseongella ginsenosidimutans]